MKERRLSVQHSKDDNDDTMKQSDTLCHIDMMKGAEHQNAPIPIHSAVF